MTIKLEGNWDKGLAYDVYTLYSVYLGLNQSGYKQFDNTLSEMGELVHRLKYDNDQSATNEIIDLLDKPKWSVDLLGKHKWSEKFDAIIPAPPSKKNRPYQPVDEIARELGKRVGVDVLLGFLEKSDKSRELKDITDVDERTQELTKVTSISSKKNISGQKVLLLDDLFRSGATLSVSTYLLYEQAKVSNVSVLTMTKTKSNR